jgi:hypothetical protein
MNRTCIVASGAYQEPELEAEFGRLPPAFLPIGNRRLFIRQLLEIRDHFDRIILSLPEGFHPDPFDISLISKFGGEIVHVPDGLSLGQSIVYVINITASSNGSISVLHGDTYLKGEIWPHSDIVSANPAGSFGYRWGYVTIEDGQLRAITSTSGLDERGVEPTDSLVLSGFFSFSSASLLVQSVMRCGGDFLRGIEEYTVTRPLRAVTTAEWLDFGHVNTYYQSRRSITTEREFNRLDPTRRSVIKSGKNSRKIAAEAHWFMRLPSELQIYAPAFLGNSAGGNEARYSIEYLHYPTLTELFVFGRLLNRSWQRIFAACDEFLSACSGHPAPAETAIAARALYFEKTMERLEAFARKRGIDLSAPCRFAGSWLPSLEKIAAITADAISQANPGHLSLVHGDFCFSNILYDARADLIRVIDPRGLDARGTETAYGDIRYDIGKLYHSVVGRYDHIVAGYYNVRHYGALDVDLDLPDDASLMSIEKSFHQAEFAGMMLDDASAHEISILLFLSMLPLHDDDVSRQDAFLANAMRLFLQMDDRHYRGRKKP